MPRKDNFYTTYEVARLLGISVRTAQQWVEKDILKGWKTDGGHRRISVKSVEDVQRSRQKLTSTKQTFAVLRILVVDDN